MKSYMSFYLKKATWRFSLPRAPLWVGQFEQLISLNKQALYKLLGKTNLNWNEPEEVLLDIEANIKSCPLTYTEEDIQYPASTPNSVTLGRETTT